MATAQCFLNGTLTSATIMPKMPATSAALAFARAHPEFSFGVHLTYVADWVEAPVSPVTEVPALVRFDGRFRESNEMRRAAILGRLPVEQIVRETRAQLSLVRDFGVKISHVDSHGHLHKFKPFRLALEEVLPYFGIRRVRAVQNLWVGKPFKSPTFWFSPIWRLIISHRFATTKHLFVSASGLSETEADALVPILGGMQGSIELGVHPGANEAWRSRERDNIQRLVPRLMSAGHTMITWNDISG